MMPENKQKVYNEKFIVCDEIREEKSGKLIIIGMYPDEKIFVDTDFPYVMDSISFFWQTGIQTEQTQSIIMMITDQDNNIIFQPDAYRGEGEGLTINITIKNLVFKSPGTYKFGIVIDGKNKANAPFTLIRREQ